MRLLVDHKQTVNAYLEEVQSLAEANSEAVFCNNLFSTLRWLDQCLTSQ